MKTETRTCTMQFDDLGADVFKLSGPPLRFFIQWKLQILATSLVGVEDIQWPTAVSE